MPRGPSGHRCCPHPGPRRRAAGPAWSMRCMDLPEVQASSRLEATIPLGDADSLQRLRERTEDTVTRPAGSTVLVDADIPPGGPADPARSLAARHPPRDRRLGDRPGGHQDRHVGLELRSLASRAVPAGASRPGPARPLRGRLRHRRAEQQLLPLAPAGGVPQLAGQAAGGFPAVGQGAARADPCPQAVRAGGMAAAHRGGLARAGRQAGGAAGPAAALAAAR